MAKSGTLKMGIYTFSENPLPDRTGEEPAGRVEAGRAIFERGYKSLYL